MKNKNSLQNILNDKTSGSSEILLKLNNYFKDSSANLKHLKPAAKHAKDNLSHFEAVNDYLNSIEDILDSGDYLELKKFTSDFDIHLQTKYEFLYKNAQPLLKHANAVLSLSNSKTLLEIFKRWRKDNKRLKIILCESRPKLEGRIFAEALLREKIKVELIYDFMISLYIPKVDAVIVGADAVLNNGNVVNKTGSTAAAILCRYFNKPFYVFSTKDKFSGKDYFVQKKQKADEVWKVKRKNVVISNFYFEEVPEELITKIITD